MSKWTLAGLALSLSLAATTAARAGSIDYLSNQSADFIRTLGRNAATDAVDIISYNPAGTAFLDKDGLYLSLNTQTVLKFYEIDYKGEAFTANDPTPVLPSFFAAYKWQHLCGFFSFTVPAGGGSLSYDDGIPYLIPLAALVPDKDSITPSEGKFSGSSMFLGWTLGASYELFGIISASAAARVIWGRKSFSGSVKYGTKIAKLDATKQAVGVGGVFGIHIRPHRVIDIGIRYETETPMEFETSSTTTNLLTDKGRALESFADGARERRNLPATLGLGVALHIVPTLTFNTNLTYYFIQQADSSEDGNRGNPLTEYVIGYDDDYENGIELNFSVEYYLTDDLLASVGYNRSWSGGNKNTYSDFEYALSSNSVAGGARYTLFDRLKLTGGFAAVIYDSGQNVSLQKFLKLPPETFKKLVFVFSLGAEYRFL